MTPPRDLMIVSLSRFGGVLLEGDPLVERGPDDERDLPSWTLAECECVPSGEVAVAAVGFRSMGWL